MNIQTVSEKRYSVSYFSVASKEKFGISVSVTGDKKAKVLKEAKEMLITAQENLDDVKCQTTD